MRVLDPVEGRVVEFAIGSPEDVEALVGELEELLALERPFALSLRGPADLADWNTLLWDARAARRRLRRMRPALAAWCSRVDLAVADPAHAKPLGVRLLGLTFGCETQAVAAA